MNKDERLAELVAESFMADHPAGPTRALAGPHASRLADALKAVIAKAVELGKNVPWSKIYALLPQIALILATSQGDWVSAVTKIVSLFFADAAPSA